MMLTNSVRRVATRAVMARLSGFRPALSTHTPAFSSPRFFSASTNLSDLLARELAEEDEAGSTVMPDELVGLKEKISQDWNILEDEGTVKMIRKGSKVTVVFHCQDTLEEGTAFDEQVDIGDEASPPIRFTLTMSKAGKTMVFNCLSEEAAAVVESVTITMEDVETIHSTGSVSDKLYQGPEYGELEEDVQDALLAFVQEDCGIDEDVAAFISMYADFKEQSCYVDWMKQMQGMIQ